MRAIEPWIGKRIQGATQRVVLIANSITHHGQQSYAPHEHPILRRITDSFRASATRALPGHGHDPYPQPRTWQRVAQFCVSAQHLSRGVHLRHGSPCASLRGRPHGSPCGSHHGSHDGIRGVCRLQRRHLRISLDPTNRTKDSPQSHNHNSRSRPAADTAQYRCGSAYTACKRCYCAPVNRIRWPPHCLHGSRYHPQGPWHRQSPHLRSRSQSRHLPPPRAQCPQRCRPSFGWPPVLAGDRRSWQPRSCGTTRLPAERRQGPSPATTEPSPSDRSGELPRMPQQYMRRRGPLSTSHRDTWPAFLRPVDPP